MIKITTVGHPVLAAGLWDKQHQRIFKHTPRPGGLSRTGSSVNNSRPPIHAKPSSEALAESEHISACGKEKEGNNTGDSSVSLPRPTDHRLGGEGKCCRNIHF